MTHKERMKLLREWEKQIFEVRTFWKSVCLLFDSSTESELFKILDGTLELYTSAVSVLVLDGRDWLEWYQYENDMGENQKENKAGAWKKARKIKNINDLCKLIEADLEVKE
jgi:hypothetical protein